MIPLGFEIVVAHCFDSFICIVSQVIRGVAKPKVTVQSAFDTLRVVDGIQRAMATGELVQLIEATSAAEDQKDETRSTKKQKVNHD